MRYLLLPIFLLALLSAGCGQKGPLFIPKPDSDLPPPQVPPVTDDAVRDNEGPR